MKLYFYPGACSLAVHIALREIGAAFDLEKVDLQAKKTQSGADYLKINPKGSVPALQLDDGQVLTEVAAVLQYVADRKPDSRLAPTAGSFERVRLQEMLNFIATEVHKGFGPMFAKWPDDAQKAARENLAKRFQLVDGWLEKSPFLLGEQITVADMYLYVMLTWARNFKVDLANRRQLETFVGRMAERPAVKAAHAAEKA